MSERPILLVGFVPPALGSLAAFQPPGSVVFVEEPDVVRKRAIRSTAEGSELLLELIEWEYQLPGAAEAFLAARPDLDPALVIPLVEYATPFAARLAAHWGLPGAGVAAADTMRDKGLLRAVTRAAGIPNPASEPVASAADLRRFMSVHSGPVVLKPANRQGAVGTRILSDAAAAEAAWAECARQDEGVMVPDRPVPLRMLAEQYVAGREYSVEMLVRDGVPVFRNVTDKVLYPGPYPVELGHVVPAPVGPDLAGLLYRRTADVLRAIGFGTGIVHCEWIVRDGVPYLVECAGRFPGDGIAELIDRAYEDTIGQHYFTLMRGGALPALPERAGLAAAVRFVPAPPGEVVAVTGVDAAAALPGVLHASVTVGPGDTVRPLRSSWDRVGSVLVCAATPAEAVELAAKAVAQVRVEVRAPA
jgi:biotin carboxylase